MITDPSMRPWLWVPAFARTTGREKRRGLCTTTLLRLRRPDAGRAGTELDRSGWLELLAVEVEHHDLFLDHALNQKRSVVLAPGETLTPVAGLGLSQRDQFLAFDAQHLHQAIIVEERTILRLVRSVDHVHGGKGPVGREHDAFRRLADRDGLNDARWFCLDVDEAHGIGVAAAGSDIGHDGDLTVRVNGEPIGPQPRRDLALGVLDLGAVDRKHGNLVVAVTS